MFHKENTKEMEGLRPGWAVKAIVVIMMTSILFRCVSATNHSVGDSTGWDLASDLRAWSAATTFHVGDSLGSFPFTLFFNSIPKGPLGSVWFVRKLILGKYNCVKRQNNLDLHSFIT